MMRTAPPVDAVAVDRVAELFAEARRETTIVALAAMTTSWRRRGGLRRRRWTRVERAVYGSMLRVVR